MAKHLATKKPVKRKPTAKYLKDKARKKNKNPELRQRLRQQKEQKEETNKKESKLNLIFKNLILRCKRSKKTEITKMTEADFFKNMKTEEEEAENLELNKYIEKELKNGINQKNDITHEPPGRGVRSRQKKNNKPQGRK
ncbi:hypothetical protein ACNF2V_23300 (plasmid) [Enterobacter hormaechei]|uniref:hypothetical protein n=1 Tax=Enterobacter hormaechei TaxID=158836 RepID=UPI003CE7A5E9